jgi:hypothetical protein
MLVDGIAVKMRCLLTTAVAAVVLTSTIAVPQHPPLPPRQSALQKLLFESLWPQAHAASEVNFVQALFFFVHNSSSSGGVPNRTYPSAQLTFCPFCSRGCCAQYTLPSLREHEVRSSNESNFLTVVFFCVLLHFWIVCVPGTQVATPLLLRALGDPALRKSLQKCCPSVASLVGGVIFVAAHQQQFVPFPITLVGLQKHLLFGTDGATTVRRSQRLVV